jgi:hypothetical protein
MTTDSVTNIPARAIAFSALCLIWCGCFLATTALAGDESSTNRVEQAYRENLKKYNSDADILVLPGLVANRKTKKVVVDSEATGLKDDEILEFLLIAGNSGHGYEALAISYAKPSDIHKALVFIGMTPGKPVNADKLQFWPKGERVVVTFECKAKGFKPVRAESLALDSSTGKPFPETGFVFVGSEMTGTNKQVYAADIGEPNSIMSTYNERTTVLDVPRQIAQGEFYGTYHPNPAIHLPTNVPLEVVLEPEYQDGTRRVLDLTLFIDAKSDAATQTIANLQFQVRDAEKKQLNVGTDLNSAVKLFSSLADEGRNPFVTIRFGNALTLQAIHDVSVILSSINTEKGIHVEPPPEDGLYFKAFMPNEKLRNRNTRIAQPWELHISRKDGKVSGTLTRVEETWKDGQARPDLKVTDYVLAAPDSALETIEKMGSEMPVLLVFAAPSLTFQELMGFVKPIRTKLPTVHVFMEK